MGSIFSSVSKSITPAPKAAIPITPQEESLTRPVPQMLIELLKRFEGCKLTSYRDTGGVWTIGFGHTDGVKANMTITQEQAEEFLREDLTEHRSFGSRMCHSHS